MLFQVSILLTMLFSHPHVLANYQKFEEDELKVLEASIQSTFFTTHAAASEI